MSGTRRPHDCDALGLSQDQRAELTGFSGRAVRALAHLREAWCGADPSNRRAVAAAIRALLTSHSLLEKPALSATVLAYGLDVGFATQLLVDVGLSADHLRRRA